MQDEQLKIFDAALVASLGERAVQLVTVAPAQTGNQHTASCHDDRKHPDVTAARLRAITRAPEAAQDLYRAGLLGQHVTAETAVADEETEDAPPRCTCCGPEGHLPYWRKGASHAPLLP